MLESNANIKSDMTWWSKPIIEEDNKNPWYSLSRTVDVEMTSYAMLVYLRRNSLIEATSIMKWLIKQRNSEGGFASTQVFKFFFLFNSRFNLRQPTIA